MKITLPTILFASLLLFAVAFLATVSPVRFASASPAAATTIGTATTSAAIAVTSSTRILATTTNPLAAPGVGSFSRVYATICNPSSTLVYVNLNGDKPAVLASGAYSAVIAAAAGYNACFEITDRNLTQGSITASSTNQTSVNVTVQDYVQ